MALRSFCGIFMKQQQKVDARILERMVAAYEVPTRVQISNIGRFAIASEFLNDRFKKKDQPIIESQRYIGSINARFDHFGDGPSNGLKEDSIEYQLKVLFNNPRLLRGDFVAAIYDKFEDQLVLIRDQMGIRPLYYLETTTYLAFSTEISPLKNIDSLDIDEFYLSDCITALRSESYRTFYKNIRKIEPAEQLVYKVSLSKFRYWHLDSEPNVASGNDRDNLYKFFQLLQQAIHRRASSLKSAGCELSGGLDSSGISSLVYAACNDAGIPFHAFSHGLPDFFHNIMFPYQDERKFSNEVCNYLGIQNHSIITGKGKGVLDSLSNDILIQSGPSQGSYHILSDELLQKVRDEEIHFLFSGHGGDEGVTAKNSGLYHELISENNWTDFRNYFFHKNSVDLRNNIKYLLLRAIPFSRAWLINNKEVSGRLISKRIENLAVNPIYKDHDFLRDRAKNIRVGSNKTSMKGHMQLRLSSSAFSQRLEYSYHAARQHDVEYLYPLLDVDLIEFYYHLPRQLKTRPGNDRYIFREVMKDRIPESIRTRKDKFGTTIPSLQLRIIEDRSLIEELIIRSQKENRYHYLDYAKMLEWQKKIEKRKNHKEPVYPVGFLNSLQILLLQEMERTGAYKSGIRT